MLVNDSDIEYECGKDFVNTCSMKKYIVYGLLLFSGLSALYLLYCLIFKNATIKFNFQVLPVFAQPIRRCLVLAVPVLFSGLILFAYALVTYIFIILMTTGDNVNVKTGTEFPEKEVRKGFIKA